MRGSLRDDVEALHALAEALDKVPPRRRDTLTLMAHRRQVLKLARRLERRTRPREVPQLVLPGEGTVARTVLEVLHIDATVRNPVQHRMLTGLTDLELCQRVDAPVNTTRPRRVDLVRGGWVAPAAHQPPSLKATKWTLTPEGLARMRALS